MVDDLLTLAKAEQPGFLDIEEVELADLTVSVVAKARALGERRWRVDEVAEAIEAGRLYHPLSLSATLTSDSETDLLEPIGEEDRSMTTVDERESIRPLIATLPERERAILGMRFFGDMTQSQIADRLGISQMHVSRLLSQTLDGLRAAVADAA